MRGFLIGTAATAITFAIVAYFLPQIDYGDNLPGLIILAVIAGVVNGFIKPIIKLFSLPLTLATLGLFGLVINAGLLLLIAWIASLVGVTFTVGGYPPDFGARRDRRGVHRRHRDHHRRLARRPRGPRLNDEDRLPVIAGALQSAARRFGTPAYVTDLAALDAACASIVAAFPDPMVRQYSVKANDVPAVDRRGRGARVRGQRRVARRMDARAARRACRTSGSRSRGSARRRRTCAPRSGPRSTARRSAGSPSNRSMRRAALATGRPAGRAAPPIDVLYRLNPDVAPETLAGLAVGAGGTQVRHDRDRRSARPSRRAAGPADRPRSGRAASTCTSGPSSAPSTRGARASARRWRSPRCWRRIDRDVRHARPGRRVPRPPAWRAVAHARALRRASSRRCWPAARPTGGRRVSPSSPGARSSHGPAGSWRGSSTSATGRAARSSSTPA